MFALEGISQGLCPAGVCASILGTDLERFVDNTLPVKDVDGC